MIPAQHKDKIISEGIIFIRAITEAYGAEEGMALWDKISSVLDPDIKGDIFFAMLTGRMSHRIRIRPDNNYTYTGYNGINHGPQVVSAIKCIRTHTSLGLKEAKELWDIIKSHGEAEIEVKSGSERIAITDLRDVGFIVF